MVANDNTSYVDLTPTVQTYFYLVAAINPHVLQPQFRTTRHGWTFSHQVEVSLNSRGKIHITGVIVGQPCYFFIGPILVSPVNSGSSRKHIPRNDPASLMHIHTEIYGDTASSMVIVRKI